MQRHAWLSGGRRFNSYERPRGRVLARAAELHPNPGLLERYWICLSALAAHELVQIAHRIQQSIDDVVCIAYEFYMYTEQKVN